MESHVWKHGGLQPITDGNEYKQLNMLPFFCILRWPVIDYRISELKCR